MTDRDLIERLLFLAQTAVDQALDLNYDDPEDYFIYRELRELKAAALAQPEPQGPTDEELKATMLQAIRDFPPSHPDAKSLSEFKYEVELEYRKARAVLARYGRPAIEPVPGVEGEQ